MENEYAGYESNIRRAVENLRRPCSNGMSFSRQNIVDVVTTICDYSDNLTDSSPSKLDNRNPYVNLDPTHCPWCRFVLVEPVTLMCGHTICTRCLTSNSQNFKCYKCSQPTSEQFAINSKINVVINNICQVWWATSVQKAKKRNEVLELYETNFIVPSDQLQELISQLYLGDDNDPASNDFDPLKASYISKLKCIIGKTVEAENLAQTLIEKIPDWHVGYQRLAEVYESKLEIEHAILYYFQAYARSPNSKLKNEMKESVINILERIFLSSNSNQDNFNMKNSYSSSSTSDKPTASTSAFLPISKSPADKAQTFIGVIDKILVAVEKVLSIEILQLPRSVDPAKVDIKDFECSLCCRILWQPVTTSCGHTFCLRCLERSLDHNTKCPLCKQSIENILNSEKPITEFLNVIIQRNFPFLYEERENAYLEEINTFKTEVEDGTRLPIFVCTNAFPGVPCPLHIFEPRYKLMLRRCMISKVRKFGMCTSGNQERNEPFSTFGTVLYVKSVNYLPDGRAIVDTIGVQRFKVVEPGMKDGYSVASVDWLSDQSPSPNEISIIQVLHSSIRIEVESWIESLDEIVKSRIKNYLGDMPTIEQDYHLLSDGPQWLWWTISVLPINPKVQTSFIGAVELKKRLLLVQKVMQMIRINPPVPF